MRSLLLAQSLESECLGSLNIHFVLNKHTNYAKNCPYDTTLLERSATKERDKVCEVIADFKPDIVIFDCAGRAAHMKAAKKVGAKGLCGLLWWRTARARGWRSHMQLYIRMLLRNIFRGYTPLS